MGLHLEVIRAYSLFCAQRSLLACLGGGGAHTHLGARLGSCKARNLLTSLYYCSDSKFKIVMETDSLKIWFGSLENALQIAFWAVTQVVLRGEVLLLAIIGNQAKCFNERVKDNNSAMIYGP